MSYGCAKRRDERRNRALPRMEATLALWRAAVASKDGSLKIPPGGVKAKSLGGVDGTPIAGHLQGKVYKMEEAIVNTKANLGKGSSAMNKKES